MYTQLADFLKGTEDGARAKDILGKCVHCGFCTATCPTYQLLGDELDGPRGRIYQIKEIIEGAVPTRNNQRHLDRCLTCLNCETTCPSGVRYGQLVEIGKRIVDAQVPRPLGERLLRLLLLNVVPFPGRIGPLVRLGQWLRPILPHAIKSKVYPRREPGAAPVRKHTRKILMLSGCVQPAMAPNIDAATRRVFDRLNIETLQPTNAGCCGAVHYHSGDCSGGKDRMRKNIDVWWPHIETGIEAIAVNASGCGAVVKEYGDILRDDPHYADKAKTVSGLCRDPVEVLQNESLNELGVVPEDQPIAFHPPCTLQHAQKLNGKVESLLESLGFNLAKIPNSHLCCGSAGTYSLMQSTLANTLRNQKLNAINLNAPKLIATANIG